MTVQTDFDEPTLIRILFCIAQHVRQYGYSQTYAELGAECHLSAGSAWQYVRALERRGLVFKPKTRKPRGIQLVGRLLA